jgi:hypothetical protein
MSGQAPVEPQLVQAQRLGIIRLWRVGFGVSPKQSLKSSRLRGHNRQRETHGSPEFRSGAGLVIRYSLVLGISDLVL